MLRSFHRVIVIIDCLSFTLNYFYTEKHFYLHQNTYTHNSFFTGWGVNMETSKNECYNIIKFIFDVYLDVLFKNINKKQKIPFYSKWPTLHLITASNFLRTPSDVACSCSCGISFHAQCSEHFKSSTV